MSPSLCGDIANFARERSRALMLCGLEDARSRDDWRALFLGSVFSEFQFLFFVAEMSRFPAVRGKRSTI
jgi:hypothetical protein